ncbi:hypothetical protein C8J57DRAFT_1486275 [Mycena rebaudengoi]|nr:hypothetical protein C8J57DRAFT_1486275 [Mycena rebaudengoi]
MRTEEEDKGGALSRVSNKVPSRGLADEVGASSSLVLPRLGSGWLMSRADDSWLRLAGSWLSHGSGLKFDCKFAFVASAWRASAKPKAEIFSSPSKVRIARRDFANADGLDVVYISTNEKGGWLDEVKNTLRKDGWAVSSSQDLILDAEQLGVSMSVDMEITRRAAVFVGNGISSFTSNIVYRRLAEGRDPISIRLW